MDISKSVTAIIGVLVAIIVFAVALVPVVDDYVDGRTLTMENDGTRYGVDDTGSATVEIKVVSEPSARFELVVNGSIYPTTSEELTIATSNLIVVLDQYSMQVYTLSASGKYSGSSVGLANAPDVVTFSENTIYSDGSGADIIPSNSTYETLVYPSLDGSYVMLSKDGTYVDNGSSMILIGVKNTGWVFKDLTSPPSIEGSNLWVISDDTSGIYAISSGQAYSATVFTAVLSGFATTEYGWSNVGAEYATITPGIQYNGADGTASSVTGPGCILIVPVEYTVKDTSFSLMSVVPLMVMLAIVMASVAFVAYKGRDA